MTTRLLLVYIPEPSNLGLSPIENPDRRVNVIKINDQLPQPGAVLEIAKDKLTKPIIKPANPAIQPHALPQSFSLMRTFETCDG
jgi:hypothetical protein